MTVHLSFLGRLDLLVNGQSKKNGLKKGWALLAYLCCSEGWVSREKISLILWPDCDPAQARERLRKLLTKLNKSIGESVFLVTKETIQISQDAGIKIDLVELEDAINKRDYLRAADLYNGDFCNQLTLGDQSEFDEWCFFKKEELRNTVLNFLLNGLREFRGQRKGQEAWSILNKILKIDPISELACQHYLRLKVEEGAIAEAQSYLEKFDLTLRESIGIGVSEETKKIVSTAVKLHVQNRIQFAVDDFGAHIAYTTFGELNSSGVDLVVIPGFITHLEKQIANTESRQWINALTRYGRVIMFDRVGMGLSDRTGDAPTTERTVANLEAVLRCTSSRKILLIGASEAGPACIQFSIKNPKTIARLVLWGTLAKGTKSEDYPYALTRDQFSQWTDKLIRNWGSPADLEVFAPSLVNDPSTKAWWSDMLRSACSPGTLKLVLQALAEVDVRHLLKFVKVPTTVIHRSHDRAVPVQAGRFIAQNISDSEFIETEGSDHWFWVGNQAVLTTTVQRYVQDSEK